MERLQKFMARHGIASRRNCEKLILAGEVKINGKVVDKLGTTIDPEIDRVEVNDKLLSKPEKLVYFMMNKPRGYITSLQDPEGRKKITDLLQDVSQRVYPVGRLDYDSEGLLILTNDGELTQALLHPSHKVPKTYRARVKGVPFPSVVRQMASGVELEEGVTAPAEIFIMDVTEGNALLEITVYEGRNRLIRRMCEKVEHPVLRLKRVKFADISLGELRSGEFRPLTDQEVRRLEKICKLKRPHVDIQTRKPFGKGLFKVKHPTGTKNYHARENKAEHSNNKRQHSAKDAGARRQDDTKPTGARQQYNTRPSGARQQHDTKPADTRQQQDSKPAGAQQQATKLTGAKRQFSTRLTAGKGGSAKKPYSAKPAHARQQASTRPAGTKHNDHKR